MKKLLIALALFAATPAFAVDGEHQMSRYEYEQWLAAQSGKAATGKAAAKSAGNTELVKKYEELERELRLAHEKIVKLEGREDKTGPDQSAEIKALEEKLKELQGVVDGLSGRVGTVEGREDQVGGGLSEAEVDKRVKDALASIEHPEGESFFARCESTIGIGAGVGVDVSGAIPGARNYATASGQLFAGLFLEDDSMGLALIGHVGYGPVGMVSVNGGGGIASYRLVAPNVGLGGSLEFEHVGYDVRDGGIGAANDSLVPAVFAKAGIVWAQAGVAVGLDQMPGVTGGAIAGRFRAGVMWEF